MDGWMHRLYLLQRFYADRSTFYTCYLQGEKFYGIMHEADSLRGKISQMDRSIQFKMETYRSGHNENDSKSFDR